MYPPLWLRMLRLYGRYFPIIRGKSSISKQVYYKLPKQNKKLIATLYPHINVELWPWLWADFCTYAIGSPEIYHLRYFQSQIKPNSVVFDVGSYIGTYAFAASAIATNGQVHIFEPNRSEEHTSELQSH